VTELGDPTAPPGERTVLLVAHTGRPDIVSVAAHIRGRLETAGIRLVALDPEAAELGMPEMGVPDSVPGDPATGPGTAANRPDTPADRRPEVVELVLTLGGDGTLLRGAEEARAQQAPVLGINLGRVGFLTETDADHLDAALDAVVSRNYRISERMTVDVSVVHDGREIATGWALNEVSVEKATRERILDVVVEVDGRGVSAFGCDGVLCATPTGSTAYAFSAGGPIIWPGVAALLVMPSNAHALFARPLVVGADSIVSLHLDPQGHEAVLACDGRRSVEIPPGARVHMRAGAIPVRLVRLTDEPFTDRLVRKFSLPVHGWRDRRH
jgi:NAD+ kinase